MSRLRRPQTLPTGGDVEQDNRPPHRARRRRVLLAGVALAAGAVLLGWQLSGTPHRPEATAAPPATSSRQQPVVVSPSPAAQGLTWRDFAGLSLPQSPVYGPRCQTGLRAACFSDDDQGAALAAVQLLVRTFPFAGSAVFTPTIRDQVTGPYAATLLRLTTQAYDQLAPAAGLTNGEPIPSSGGWVAGYHLDPTASPSAQIAGTAVGHGQTVQEQTVQERSVQVLIRQADTDGQSGFTSYDVQLLWRRGDWALVAPAWGDWRSSATAMSTADPAMYATYDTITGP